MSDHFLNIPSVYKLGTRWIGSIPQSLAYALSQCIALVSYLSYKTAVFTIKSNLAIALPAASKEEIAELSMRLFRNYGKYLVDYGRFTSLGKESVIGKIVYYDGRKNLEKAIAMKKGIILLTAHLGNWELGGIFFGSSGLKTNVVTIRDSNSEIDSARRSYRERHDVNTITIGDSPFSTVEMLKALNNGEVVAMLIDRWKAGLDYLEMDFFGRPARFPRGPFTLSRLTGAPIIVAFVVREGEGYKGIIEKPLLVEEEGREPDALMSVVKILERYIIKYPDQWYNFTPL